MAMLKEHMRYQDPARVFERPSIIHRVMRYSQTESYMERQLQDRSIAARDYEGELMSRIHHSRIYQDLLRNGVFLRIVTSEDIAMMTRNVELVGYFTPEQFEQYEKNRMIDKLAGRDEHHGPVNYKI